MSGEIVEVNDALSDSPYFQRVEVVAEREATVDRQVPIAVHLTPSKRQRWVAGAGYGTITTTVEPAGPFYYAEAYPQQYLAKNPGGYCGIGGTGVACPVGVGVAG